MASKNKKSRFLSILISILLILVILFTASGTVLAATVPSPGDLIPEGNSPIDVTILTPDNGDEFLANKDISIYMDIVGANIIEYVEIFANGERIADRSFGSGNHAFISLAHSFPNLGNYMITARVTDSEGYVGMSNPISIEIVRPEEVATVVELGYAHTLSDVAEQSNLDIDVLLAMNPDLGVDNPQPQGTIVNIPLDPDAVDLDQISVAPIPTIGGGADEFGVENTDNLGTKITTFMQTTLFPPDDLPAAPDLVVQNTSPCYNLMYIYDNADNETGFFVYRAKAGGSFERIATLKANNNADYLSITDRNVFGNYTYYVSAFNGAGESPSVPVSFSESDPSCINEQVMQLKWLDTSFETTSAIDSFYCYVDVYEGQWHRFPQNPRDVFAYTSDAFNDVNLVPPQITINDGEIQYGMFNMECWGWQGDNLVSLGSGAATFELQGNIIGVSVSGAAFDFNGYVGYVAESTASGMADIDPMLSLPSDLHFIDDPTECSEHQEDYGEKDCIEDVKDNLLDGKHVLAWELVGRWPSAEHPVPVSKVKKYHLYKYDIDSQDFVSYKYLGLYPTTRTLSVSGNEFAGQPVCYAMRAVHELENGDVVESDWSNIACLEPDEEPVQLKTVQIPIAEMYSFLEYNTDDTAGQDMIWDEANVISYRGSGKKNPYRDHQYAYIRFDLSDYQYIAIQSATLSFKYTGGGYTAPKYSGVAWGGVPSCYKSVTYKLDNSWFTIRDNVIYHKGTKKFDVTDQVTNVINLYGQDQFMVMLNPWDLEQMGIPNLKKEGFNCIANYDNFVLEITYFPGYVPGGGGN